MTKRFGDLNSNDVGKALVYRDRGRTHRVKIAGLEHKSSYLVAYVTTGYSGERPLTLPADIEVTVEL
ncbi:hypothetical protein D5S18_28255 [Nocardia panacis]|uniref:Uncharacterized protein n=1 Tax=Nocardia panacis TaxID=2340916 RepID=A0A3A4JUE3_9NOCA|nr:hypothetical protein [Nocardia panacis]RJO69795.1 hypothetical protein D5S18_28255 [Nocardia panacis]